MYLSKVVLDYGNPSVRQGLRDCHDMHRNVMRLFDDERSHAGVLYRLQQMNLEAVLWVLSAAKPMQPPGKIGMRVAGSRELSPFLDSICAGDRLAFDLLAAPSKKVGEENVKNSRRRFLTAPEERLEWLGRKAAEGGFRILSCREEEQTRLYGVRKSMPMCFNAVQFRGMLEVEDADGFRAAYGRGIGPEKAYGCGLMLLLRTDE